ncbi:hypothetical protein SAMN02745116_02212 [Pilibacter termitis]|jgi:hypothetical protein|uniref:Uncharacterized protein n=1 Tax=Pilibacter termitis TaxID=263852 RepID=A0A1T4QJJ9_9ENTE|nr:hypothetical protein SAMN02745116_02212 [Pilibacter termitis]
MSNRKLERFGMMSEGLGGREKLGNFGVLFEKIERKCGIL